MTDQAQDKVDISTEETKKTLGDALRERKWGKYTTKVQVARDNLYKALSDDGNPGWVSQETRGVIEAVIDREQKSQWPRVYKWAVRSFMDTYSKLLAEFPHLEQKFEVPPPESDQ